MKRTGCIYCLVLFCGIWAFNVSAAEDRPWSGAVDTSFYSKYIWRGINITDDPVFQPSVLVAYKNLSLSVWGNMDMTDINDNSFEFNELDYNIDYSWNWHLWNLTLGAIRYEFPNTRWDGTTEVYGSLGLETLLSPTVTVYRDVDEIDGTYAEISVGHAFHNIWVPNEDIAMSLDLTASVGYGGNDYNDGYFGVDDSCFTDVLATAAFPVVFGEHFALTPSISWSSLIDEEIREVSMDDDNLWYGVSVGYSF